MGAAAWLISAAAIGSGGIEGREGVGPLRVGEKGERRWLPSESVEGMSNCSSGESSGESAIESTPFWPLHCSPTAVGFAKRSVLRLPCCLSTPPVSQPLVEMRVAADVRRTAASKCALRGRKSNRRGRQKRDSRTGESPLGESRRSSRGAEAQMLGCEVRILQGMRMRH